MQDNVFILPARESTDPGRKSIHNLPAQLTPLIGREQEVAASCALLRRPEVRLFTLSGTGGIGKTRLALRVATDLLDDFPDGVYLVLLAPISDPDLVIPTVAQTLGVKEAAARPLLDLLKAHLQDKHLLLVLDNFEQVINAAPVLTELLESSTSLKLLVTSREVLRIRGEHEYPVPPLTIPALQQQVSIEGLAQYAAVTLFLQRAQAVKPDFHLTEANASAITAICTRLDGLPLALELAAARVKLLPPQALLTRLSQRFQVLTGGSRTLPARQQTLRNTLQWSYDLLTVQEQRFFRRLSVFTGGWALEAAEAVWTAVEHGTFSVLDVLASLLDKSLLLQVEQEGEEPRLQMLMTVREYGLECLHQSGEAEQTQRAHAAYYLALAERAEPELEGPQQVVWLERLEREHDNLRAALDWSLEQAEDEQTKPDQVIALRLAGALRWFWYKHGHVREGRTFLERVLARRKGTIGSEQLKALHGAMIMNGNQGDYERAEALGEESLALCRAIGDTPGLAQSLQGLGWFASLQGNLARARSLFEESLTLCREVGNKSGLAATLCFMARLAGMQGEYTRSSTLFEEGLAHYRAIGDKYELAITSYWMAQMLFVSQGDPLLVGSLLSESLTLAKELRHEEMLAFALRIVGQVALSQGDNARARELAEKSLALFRKTGGRMYVAEVLYLLASVEAHRGDHAAACAFYEEGLAEARAMGNKLAIAPGLEGLAGAVAVQGEFTWAVQLWGVAVGLREALGMPLPPVDRAAYECSVADARLRLGETVFAAAWAEGRAMTPEQALAAQGKVMIPTPMPARGASTPLVKPPTYPDGLTTREVEVLGLVAQGLTNEQVSEQLVISARTVSTHLTSIYGKIQVSSRSAATRYAMEHHLL